MPTKERAGPPRMKRRWIPVFLWMAVIYAVSEIPFGLPIFARAEKIHLDWLVHVVEYGVLGFLLARAFGHPRYWAAALLIGALYGASDEWHQRWVPPRDPSAQDACADTIGVALGAWCWTRQQRKKL